MEQDENAELTAKLHAHQSKAGRAGGRSRSEAKRAAVRANLAKARLRRWPGREAAALAAYVPIPKDEAEGSGQGEVDAHSREKERPLPQDRGGAIQEPGPSGPSPLPDQPNSRDGQPANGGFNLLRFAKERG